MRVPLLFIVCSTLVASDPGERMADSVARMRVSVERQREAIRRQVLGAAGDAFFATAWADARPVAIADSPAASGDCDPLAPDQLRPLVVEASVREGINPLLVQAVVRRESGGKPCAVSSKGAQGLMQLMPATQSDLGVRDPFDPAENIGAGARYLKQLLARYKSDLRLALAAYNAGPQRVEPGGQVPAIAETQAYVRAIMTDLKASEEAEPVVR